MGSSRRLRQASGDAGQAFPPITWLPRLVPAGCMALTVLAVLIPSEAAIPEGSFAPLAAGWCLLLVLWTASVWLAAPATFRWGWTELGVVALVLWHTLAAIVHLSGGNARQTLHALWLVVGYGVALFLWRQVLRCGTLVHATLLVMLWLATTLAGWGVFQTAYSFPRLRQTYAHNPTQLLAEQGLPSEAGTPQRELFENRLQSTEPLASFALTNSLAGFLAPWLIVGIALATARHIDPQLRWMRIAAWVAAAILGLCLLLTKSRTAYLATAVGLVLIPFVRRWRPASPAPAPRDAPASLGAPAPRAPGKPDNKETLKSSPGAAVSPSSEFSATRFARQTTLLRWGAFTGGAALLMVVAATAAGWLDWKVLAEAPLSLRYRFEYWQATWAMIREHPLWGCGPGNFQSAYAHYKLPQSSEMVADPHNIFLEVAATAGLPALLLLLATIAAFVVELWRGGQFGEGFETLGSGEVGADAPGSRKVGTDVLRHRGLLDVPSPHSARENTLFWGALVGLVVALPLSLAIGFPLETWGGLPVVWWLGVPLLLALWWASRDWLPSTSIMPGSLVVALVVLGLHLQAAGAFVFPGVMMTLVVLVPAALTLRTGHGDRQPSLSPLATSEVAAQRRHPRPHGIAHSPNFLRELPAKTGLTLGAIVLFATCMITEYYPVLRCRLAMERARSFWQAGQEAAAEQQLLTACQADPHTPQPWELLAELRLQRWLKEPSEAHREAFLEAAREFTRRDPRSHVVWYTQGGWLLRMWGKSSLDRDLRSAIEAFQAAVHLYPNRALYHAQLAWTFYLAGHPELARQEADRAWSLDEQMPHREQKLNRQKLLTTNREGGGKTGELPEPSEARAEQMVAWLRKLSVKPAEVEPKREGAP